jgi:PIN domain nuclease of toxin-antitoxin system
VSVLLDAFALIALLRDEPAADEVEAILRRGDAALTAINLAEVLDVLQRVDNIDPRNLDAVLGPLVAENVTLHAVDERLAHGAAALRARHYHRTRCPVSLADCVLLAAADQQTLVTADEPLARAARTEGIEVLALPDSRGRRP